LSDQDYTTIGGTLLGLAIGWAMKHFGIGGAAVPTIPAPAPIPAPSPASLEARMLLIEARLDAISASVKQLLAREPSPA
jgi:hypothetical protein